jgi:putative transposon-encoded protein
MESEINDTDDPEDIAVQLTQANSKLGLVKFEVFGEEMIDKEVKLSGNSGRVYLPPGWVGHRVKIIRID